MRELAANPDDIAAANGEVTGARDDLSVVHTVVPPQVAVVVPQAGGVGDAGQQLGSADGAVTGPGAEVVQLGRAQTVDGLGVGFDSSTTAAGLGADRSHTVNAGGAGDDGRRSAATRRTTNRAVATPSSVGRHGSALGANAKRVELEGANGLEHDFTGVGLQVAVLVGHGRGHGDDVAEARRDSCGLRPQGRPMSATANVTARATSPTCHAAKEQSLHVTAGRAHRRPGHLDGVPRRGSFVGAVQGDRYRSALDCGPSRCNLLARSCPGNCSRRTSRHRHRPTSTLMSPGGQASDVAGRVNCVTSIRASPTEVASPHGHRDWPATRSDAVSRAPSCGPTRTDLGCRLQCDCSARPALSASVANTSPYFDWPVKVRVVVSLKACEARRHGEQNAVNREPLAGCGLQ